MAQRIGVALRLCGHSIWWDAEVDPVERWDSAIEREITAATHVLVLWTEHSVESDWVRVEAHFARNSQPNKLIQARFDNCEIPLAFSIFQYVDLDPEQPSASPRWRELLSWLSAPETDQTPEASANQGQETAPSSASQDLATPTETYSGDRYDVALSFSGTDRAIALSIAEQLRLKGVNVFYDEWHTVRIWGSDLTASLRSTYLNASFCVPLFSQSYVEGTYPQFEFKTLLERELYSETDFLLPVRLDDSPFPEQMRKSIAYVDYRKLGAKGVAELIVGKLAIRPSGESSTAAKPPTDDLPTEGLSRPSPVSIKTHRRQFPRTRLLINDEDLLAHLANPALPDSAELQAKLAHEFVVFLRLRYRLNVGAGCAAWMQGDRFLLSTLPDFGVMQRTFEFFPTGEGLRLEYEWEPLDEKLRTIGLGEWQPAVTGLMADRTILNLDREIVLLILEKKGLALGYPVSPQGSEPARLCGWIEAAPSEDYLDWGRDPTLVAGDVGTMETIFHRPTGIGFLTYCLRGRWSAAAFSAFSETLRILLPSRHHMRILSAGAIRIDIYLGAQFAGPSSADDVFRLNLAAVFRLSAALRQIALPPALDRCALAEISERERDEFSHICDMIGDAEYVETVDSALSEFFSADWIKLRQASQTAIAGYPEPSRPDFSQIATPRDCREVIAQLETVSMAGD